MSRNQECSLGIEASYGGVVPEPPQCTARHLLGLQQRGEAVHDDSLAPLIVAGRAVTGYNTATGEVVEVLLACESCAIREEMALNDEGGVESIEPFPGAPAIDEACIVPVDGGVSAGVAVMQYIQRST